MQRVARKPVASLRAVSAARAFLIGLRPRRAGTAAGDRVLFGLSLGASALTLIAVILIVYEVASGAWPSVSDFGLGFLVHASWRPNFGIFGAAAFLYGTVISSLLALLIATPIGIAIGLYLSMLAPKAVRGVVGPLVEMLAAVPSVILGFWGILVLGPVLAHTIEPWLHTYLGFIPLFGAPATTGLSIFNAVLLLTVMVVPIIASISRDLFLTVPRELQDGAAALGATRWETVRGVVLPSTAAGVAAAAFLGLGRALGEAIAVTQVIGGGSLIHTSLFETGDTLASRIASQFQGAATKPLIASLFYLGLIILVIGLLANLSAQWISRRFDPLRIAAR